MIDKGTWASVSIQDPATLTFIFSVIEDGAISYSAGVSAIRSFAPTIDSLKLCKFSQMPTVDELEDTW